MEKKILIGLPSASGQVPIETVQSLLQLIKPYPTAFMSVVRQRTDKARNGIAMECLRNGFDYLFFFDDDQTCSPDTLEKLVGDDKDVVIAPILSRNPDKDGKRPLCAFYSTEIDTSIGKVKLYNPIEKFRDDGPLHRIDGAGTGCMLIKRKVLEEINKKHQDYIFEFGDKRFDKVTVDGKEYDRRTMSEDVEFSERVVDAGFEIWLDDRVRPFHMGRTEFIQFK